LEQGEIGMASQGIWSGTISFGLVAIPVRLVKAIEPGRLSFHLLHKKDYSRLSRKMFCPEEKTVVSPDEIARGYEILPEKFILMTEEELESVSPERSRTIEIVEFTDMNDIDPIYYDHPYYLIPAKGGEKAYQLLAEIMHRTNKGGLAKFVLAEREYLVVIKSRGGAIELTTLHYSDEILSDEDISPKKDKIDAESESKIVKSIEQMMQDFNPGKYSDKRRKQLMDILAKKIKDQTPVEAPAAEEEEGEGPPDLVAALEESMRKVREKR
jgi:DNA end-binding protein Ku